jgi:TrpR-related protein YerC/YecD
MNHVWNTCAFRKTLQQYRVPLFFIVLKPPTSTGGSSRDLVELADTLVAINDREECLRFLRDLCTIAELNAMAERWAIARMLWQRVPYKRIVHERRASSTTVARVARWLHGEVGGYRRALLRRHAPTIKGVVALSQ